MANAAGTWLQKTAFSIILEWVKRTKEKHYTYFIVLVRKLAVECSKYVPGEKLRLTFVKSGHMIPSYIPAMTDVDLKKIIHYRAECICPKASGSTGY